MQKEPFYMKLYIDFLDCGSVHTAVLASYIMDRTVYKGKTPSRKEAARHLPMSHRTVRRHWADALDLCRSVHWSKLEYKQAGDVILKLRRDREAKGGGQK